MSDSDLFSELLPDELQVHVLSFLSPSSLARCSAVCRKWNELTEEDLLWKEVYREKFQTIRPPDASLSPKQIRSRRTSTAAASATPSPLLTSSTPSCFKKAKQDSMTIVENENEEKKDEEKNNSSMTETEEPLSPSSSMVTEKNVVGNRGRIGNVSLDLGTGWKRNCQYRVHLLEKPWKKGSFQIQTLEGHTDNVYCLHFNDEYLVSSSQDKTVRVWKTSDDSFSPLQELRGHSAAVGSVFLHGQMAVSGSDDKSIKVWDLRKEGSEQCCVKTIHVNGWDGIWALQFDEEKLVAGTGRKTARIWDMNTFQEKMEFKGHEGYIETLQYSNNVLFTGAQDAVVIMWDMRTGKKVSSFEGCTSAVYSLQADDEKLLSGCADSQLRRWDLRSPKECVWTVKKHAAWIGGVMNDCCKVITASADKSVGCFDINTGELWSQWSQHSDSIRTLQFNEDTLVTGSFDTTIKVWRFDISAQ
ncbi:POC1 centriolar A [Balamuthia mandrillaris]